MKYLLIAVAIGVAVAALAGCDYTDEKYHLTAEEIDRWNERYPCGLPSSPLAPALRKPKPERCQ